MRWNELEGEACSLARTVGVIGDRWTLLILRDAFLGVRRVDEFQERLGLSRALLTDRLRTLVDGGLLDRAMYQERPERYEYRLTPAGLDFYPVMLAMADWGNRHRGDGRGAPLIHRHTACGQDFRPVTTCSECGEPVDARSVSLRAGAGFADPRARRQTARAGQAI